MTAPDTSTPLDLDAIEARINCAPSCDCGEPSTQWCADSECGAEACDGHARQTGALGHEHRWLRYPVATGDARALVARVRDLAAKLDASAQAFDDLVAEVWRAAGETHEPPADVAALVARVAGLREAAVAARARIERDVCEAAGEVWDPRHDAADVVRRAVASARREGAEAMREACADAVDDAVSYYERATTPTGRIIAAIRALPLPEAPDAVSAYRRGAEAMREESAQAAARVANAWARREHRCECGSSLAGLAAAEACTAAVRDLPIAGEP